jgi:hypothetical protein
MRSLPFSPLAALILLTLSSTCSARAASDSQQVAGDPGAPHSPAAAAARRKLGLTDAQCGQAQGYLSGVEASGLLRPDGLPQAHVKREVWAALNRDTQSSVIWSLARFAACYDGKALHTVTIRDEHGAAIATQAVSFDPHCHGDLAGPAANSIWYRC